MVITAVTDQKTIKKKGFESQSLVIPIINFNNSKEQWELQVAAFRFRGNTNREESGQVTIA